MSEGVREGVFGILVGWLGPPFSSCRPGLVGRAHPTRNSSFSYARSDRGQGCTMSDGRFVHLHCHSHYSLLDGASKIPDLVQRAKTLGMPTRWRSPIMATSRRGRVPPRGEDAGPQADRRPGSLRRSRHAHRSHDGRRLGTGIRLPPDLARGRTARACRNLMRLSSRSFLEGYYYKPRIDKEILEQHAEGLICLSGCASGRVLRPAAARARTPRPSGSAPGIEKVFGAENFYVEIQ